MEKLESDHQLQLLIELAESYFKGAVLAVDPLKGDGSDRRIYRITPGAKSIGPVVGVVFDNTRENQDFFRITDAFQQAGLPAARIYSVSQDESAYLMQDLGLWTLAEKISVWNRENQSEKTISAYKQVLDCLIRIQQELPPILGRFLSGRKMDLAVHKTDLEYFRKEFIQRFGLSSFLTSDVDQELQSILNHDLSEISCDSFVYRDFQARNIMWLEDAPWFIDYQSAFLGPCHYDLASLLFGSKSGLDDQAREKLVRYYYNHLQPDFPAGYELFRKRFLLFVVLRRLRSLGSYGFLAGSKGKTGFFESISPTLLELTNLLCFEPVLSSFGQLRKLAETLSGAWTQNESTFRSRLIKRS